MKKNLIKILTALLVLCMSIGMGSASAKKAKNVEVTEKMEILRLFGIIPDYYDFNTSFSEEVSRADFVDVVGRMVNAGAYSSSNVFYYDVLKSHYAYESISALTELGVISGTGYKMFSPDEPIQTVAASKILVSLLGYENVAVANGGYPNGYMEVSQQIELYEGVENIMGNLTRGDMINILYNALDIYMLSYDGKETDDTLLSRYHDVYYGEGVITAASCISIKEYSLKRKDAVMIDDEVYSSKTDVSDYLGQKVEFFWYDNKKENTEELLWVKAEDDADVLSLEINDNASFNSDSFVYTYNDENNRKKSITLSRGTTLIYNGVCVESGFGAILNKEKYSVKFVETDGEYNIAIVKAYENYVVERITTTDNIVYDKTGKKEPLKLEDNSRDCTILKDSEGNEKLITDIAEGDVLSVFQSLDGKYMEIIITSQTKTGTVTSIHEDNGDYIIELSDDTTYYMPYEAYNKSPKFNLGDNVKLFIDHAGEVAYVDTVNSSEQVAYVIGVYTDELSEKASLKLLLQDGKIAKINCAENFVLDGKKSYASNIKAELCNEEGAIHQLILIKLDHNGEIKKIDTPVVNEKHGETKANTLTERLVSNQRYSSSGAFGGVCVTDANTIFFRVPDSDGDRENEKYYEVIKKTDLVDSVYYYIATYNTTDRVGSDEFVVIKMSSVYDNGKYSTILPVLVTGVETALNSDGEAVEAIKAIQGTSEDKYMSNGEYSFKDKNIKKGMLLQLSVNKTGEVCDAEVIFDPDVEYKPQGTISALGTYMVNRGYVHDVVDDVMKIGFKTGADIDYVAMRNAAPVLIYDGSDERNPVYVGSFADAKRYFDVNSDLECSKAVVISRYFAPRLYVIYK